MLSESHRPALERGSLPAGLGCASSWPRVLPRPFGSVCRELAAGAGIEVRRTRPKLESSSSARARMSAQLETLGIAPDADLVLLNAASRPDSAKGVPAKVLVRLLADLAGRTSARFLLLTAPGEGEVASRVLAECAGPARPLALPEPPDLPDLLALLERASLLVTADSGPRHLAVATGCPAVVLFGPTDPRHSAEHLIRGALLRAELECAPCHAEVCPLGGEQKNQCWSSLGGARILRAVQGILSVERAR